MPQDEDLPLANTFVEPPQVVPPGFENQLIEGIDPIRSFYLAIALHHFFQTGLYDFLDKQTNTPSQTVSDIATSLNMDLDRLSSFCNYLANEGLLKVSEEKVALTSMARKFAGFAPWYTLLVGGYLPTLIGLGQALEDGSDPCTRDDRLVGVGSCQVSQYDGLPIVNQLLESGNLTCTQVLDLGCGNGLYLAELCREFGEATMWGVEPDPGAFHEAQQLIGESAFVDRVNLVNKTAEAFLQNPPNTCLPDVIVLAFVLHEMLAQEGRQAVVELLKAIPQSFPAVNIVVVEVLERSNELQKMQSGLGLAFWNPYFLMHGFTNQRLQRASEWDNIFEEAGLHVVATTTTDGNLDSTLIEWGYLIKGKEAVR